MKKYNLTALIVLSFIAQAGYGMDETGLYGLPAEHDPLAPVSVASSKKRERGDPAPVESGAAHAPGEESEVEDAPAPPGEPVRKRRGPEAVPPPELPTVPAKPKQTSRIMGIVASFTPSPGNFFSFGAPVPGNFQEIEGLLRDRRLNNVNGVSIDPKTSGVSTEVLKVTGHVLSESPSWKLEQEVLSPYFLGVLNDASLSEKLEAFQTAGVTDGIKFVKSFLHGCMALNKTTDEKISFAKSVLRLSPEAFQFLFDGVEYYHDLCSIIRDLGELDVGEIGPRVEAIMPYLGTELFAGFLEDKAEFISAFLKLSADEIGPRVEAIMPYLRTKLFAGFSEYKAEVISAFLKLSADEIGPRVGAIEQCLEEPWFKNDPYMYQENQSVVIAALTKLDVGKIEAIRKHAGGFLEGQAGSYKATVIEAFRELDVGKIEAIGESAAKLFQDLDDVNQSVAISALGKLDVGEIRPRVEAISPYSGGVFEDKDGLLFPGLSLDEDEPGKMIEFLVGLDRGGFEKAISRADGITSVMTLEERFALLRGEEEEGSSGEDEGSSGEED